MNNLNNPDDWNIRADRPGGGDSSRWNYALLVPMLGLAAFRYSWSKESQKEIEKIKIECDKVVKTIQMDLKQTLSEKTTQTTQLKQNLEEKEKALKIKDEEQLALVALKEVEYRLMERQRVYCSYVVSHSRRLEIEDDLLNRLAKQTVFANLNMEDGLRNIFRNDHVCSDIFNRNDRKNGKIMWDHLGQWQTQLTQKTNVKTLPDILNDLTTYLKSI